MKYYLFHVQQLSRHEPKLCDFRWWAAAHSVQHANIPISVNLIKLSADIVQKLRGTLRYALGVLNDFPVELVVKSSSQSMSLLDQYMLHSISKLKINVSFACVDNCQSTYTCFNILAINVCTHF